MSYRFTRFATNSVAIALLILSALSIPVSASLQSADQTALGNLAERFFAAYQKQDLDALMLLWSEKSADYAASKQSLQQSFTANKIELKSTTIGKLTLDGEKASLRVVMDSSAVEVKTGKPADGFGKKNRTLHFIKESGVWKVSRFVSSEEELAAAIATAKTAEERKALLEADRELVTIELPRALNEQSTRLRNRGSSSQALAVSQMALTIAQELGDKPAIATALRNTGIVYQLQGNTPLAMENYQKSLNIYEAIGDKSGISNTLNSIGLAHFSQGNHTHAMENYQKSLSISEAIGFKAGIANTLNNLGNIHISQGDAAQALDYYHRSLKIAEEIGNKTSIANTLNNLGIVYQSQGNYTQAMEYHQKNLKNRMEIGDKSGLSSTLNNIGNILLLQGNYAQALEYFQKSLTLREELGYKDRIAITLNDIGTAHQWQGNYAQALEYYQKSLNLSEETGNKTTISGNLNNIGLAHQSQGNYTQAMEYYQKSLKISEAIGYKAGIANVLNNIGIIHRFQGNNAQALDYYHRSLKLKEESGLKAGIANTLNNIGNVFLLEGNYTQALAYYERSLKIKEEIGYKDGIAIVLNDIGSLHQMQGNYTQALELANKAAAIAKEIGYLEMSWQARTTAGQAYRALNQFDLARQSFTDAIATIEDLRYQIAGAEQHQQQFFESKLFPYYEMIDLLIAQNNPQEALSFAERSKSRVLLDVLRGGKVNITKAMSSQEQEEERNLNSELVSLNSQLYKEKQREQSDQIRLADLAARLEKTRLQVEAFQTNLYAAHPELRVQRGEFHPITATESTPLIPDSHTALVEFVVQEKQSYLFILTRTNKAPQAAPDLKVYKLNIKQKELADLTQRFNQRISSRSLGFQELAAQLYDLLLKPAHLQLQNINKLVIVPDGGLWELPFQALLSAPNRFLIQDYAVSYAPSLTVLKEMQSLQARRRKGNMQANMLLALGNPAIGAQTARKVSAVFMDEKLLPLPEAERQVKALQQIYGSQNSKVYIGAEASEGRLKQEAGHYQILHLAAHGILNDASPMYSHLVLSQLHGNAGDDGLLEAWEIMKMDLKADLIILSACDTARGRVGAGEGVIGLAWALFVAGAPTTVVSQWKVETESNTELMVAFHHNLRLDSKKAKGSSSKAEALRQATLKLMKNKKYSHPFYWAPFIIVGDAN